ncbi:MAG: hypothetical protein ACUVQH_03030, partial [Thermogutta sp.]
MFFLLLASFHAKAFLFVVGIFQPFGAQQLAVVYYGVRQLAAAISCDSLLSLSPTAYRHFIVQRIMG